MIKKEKVKYMTTNKKKEINKAYKKKYIKRYSFDLSYKREDPEVLALWESIKNKPDFIRHTLKYTEEGKKYLLYGDDKNPTENCAHYAKDLKKLGLQLSPSHVEALKSYPDVIDRYAELARTQHELLMEDYKVHPTMYFFEPTLYLEERTIIDMLVNLKLKGKL